MKPKYSIIIPTYNYAERLPAAIKSVLCQDEQSLEIIVIDDGSTDTTTTVMDEFSDSRIRFVVKENGGAASARNRGIQESQGEYLLFLDADDCLYENSLTVFNEAIAQSPDTLVFLGGHYSINKGKKTTVSPSEIPLNPFERLQQYLNKKIPFMHGPAVIHKKVFENISYPEQFRAQEDLPVFAWILAGFNCISIKTPVVEIFKHKGSLRHNADLALATETKIVDTIFNPDFLTPEMMKMKKWYYSKRCLSLFRTLYLSGRSKEGRDYFYEAVKNNWKAAFNWSYTSKFFRSFL